MEVDEDAVEAAPRGIKRKAGGDDDDDYVDLQIGPKKIRALAPEVVNKIAAGEIIVAPVHALKELTENAVDAGATSIEIVVKDGGLKLLQITDNGHGINREDMPILCERFTTSKLKEFDDLMSIGTYGFRGEALASISHIAHLQITTKTKDSSAAYRAHYSGGKLVPAKPGQTAEPKACAGRPGTQITVEDLFYNVPSRRRAFRAAAEEYNKILDLVGRYAVHCSGVAFSCKKHSDSSMDISVQASASTVDRIRHIHSNQVANELLHLEATNKRWGFSCDSWISNANYHVKKVVFLLFINHRAVESSAIKKAVEQIYTTFLPKGGHPFVYLSLEIDPQRVDVNVHPTKREVNFLNEEEIIEAICEEIQTRLGNVDTSRTFMTQTLLPGVRIPTISSESFNTPSKGATSIDGSSPFALAGQLTRPTPQRTPALRTYENNLVRTDSKIRKITSMFSSAASPSNGASRTQKATQAQPSDGTDSMDPMAVDAIQYSYIERDYVSHNLTSIKELRAEVREEMHNHLTDVFATHTFVGIVDERRRVAAIQGGVKLFLVDYGMLSNEYFYQLGLTDFGNFGSILLDPPLNLRELLQVEVLHESQTTSQHGSDKDINWDSIVDVGVENLLSKRDMLKEYFSLEISAEGEQVRSIPLLVKGYMPSMTKLPRFLLRLGPHVDWTDEKECFRSFLTELAAFYVPEPLPSDGRPVSSSHDQGNADHTGAGGSSSSSISSGGDIGDGSVDGDGDDKMAIYERRRDVQRALENVLFPAFKSRLIATRGLLNAVTEVADLKGLYRVFERC